MFCTSCATFNLSTATRCHSCGALLERKHESRAKPRVSTHRNWLLALPLALLLVLPIIIAWQNWSAHQQRTIAYENAVTALSAGDLPNAISLFGQAGGYRDAQTQRILTQQQLAAQQATLLDAQAALDRGANRYAIELLHTSIAAFPQDRTAIALLATAEERFHTELVHDSSIAISNRDWLRAEHRLLQLAFWDESDPAVISLPSLQWEHAPILFTGNGALSWIGPDLTDRKLIFDDRPVSLPVWNPDRTKIAFYSIDSATPQFGALYVIDVDGKRPVLIHEHAIVDQPVWSPDGHQLVYSAAATSDSGASSTVLQFFDLPTGSVRTLVPPSGFDRLISPSWSGDGQQLVAIAQSDTAPSTLAIIDSGTFEQTLLSDSTPHDIQSVSWSPIVDTLLLWTSPNESDVINANGNTISLLSLTDLVLTPVTPSTQAPSRPVWAPDGRHFAYLDRGKTLHIRIRDGIGDRSIGLPNKGNGVISWGPGSVGVLVTALDPLDPAILIPVGDRLGPVTRLSLPLEDNTPAIDFQWGPSTQPLPALYDPVRSTDQ